MPTGAFLFLFAAKCLGGEAGLFNYQLERALTSTKKHSIGQANPPFLPEENLSAIRSYINRAKVGLWTKRDQHKGLNKIIFNQC